MSLSRLLQTPLLQGISRRDLLQIAAKAKISFERHAPNRKIMRQDQPQSRLFCVLSGEVEIHTISPCRRFQLTETTAKPPLIGLDTLFGLRQICPCTLVSRTYTETMSIEKSDMRDVLLLHPVIRLNILTQLSRQASRESGRLWDTFPQTTPARFVHFLQHRLYTPLGHKCLRCRLVDLATELSVTRLHLSRTLHGLQDRGLLVMGRSHIDIPRFEEMLTLLNDK